MTTLNRQMYASRKNYMALSEPAAIDLTHKNKSLQKFNERER